MLLRFVLWGSSFATPVLHPSSGSQMHLSAPVLIPALCRSCVSSSDRYDSVLWNFYLGAWYMFFNYAEGSRLIFLLLVL